jgi:hypothetical protein
MKRLSNRALTIEAFAGRTDLLSIQQFAHRVGVPASEVLRNHQEGYFLAAVGGGKGRGKQRLYAPEQVAEYKQMLKAREPQAVSHLLDKVPYSAEDAQRAFQALREGKTLAEIVLEKGIHPDVAMAIGQAWQRLTGAIFISGETLQKISGLALTGPLPVKNEDDLFEVLRIAADDTACTACKKSARTLCKKCVAQALLQARQEERDRLQPPKPEPEATNGAVI